MHKINSVIRNYTSKGTFKVKDVKILYIDDNQIDMSISRDIKYMYDVDVDICYSDDSVYDRIIRNKYDIVFIDYSLKGKDFDDVARGIRRIAERVPKLNLYITSLPIIVSVGSNTLGGRRIVLGDVVDDFVPHPSDTYYIDRLLKKWLPASKRTSTGVMEERIAHINDHTIIDENSKYYDNLKVPGLDIAKCMKKCHFDKAKYLLFLNDIYKKSMVDIESLEYHITHGDILNFIEKVHDLKEFAKEIGADTLYEMAKTQEIAAYSGDYNYILGRVGTLFENYDKIISGIEEVLKNNLIDEKELPVEQRLPISYAETQNEIFLILKYIDDIRPQAAIKAIKRLLCCKVDNATMKLLYKVNECIEEMEYEKAMYYLTEMLRNQDW